METNMKSFHQSYLVFSLLFGFVCSLGAAVIKKAAFGLPLFELLWGSIGAFLFLNLMDHLIDHGSGEASFRLSLPPQRLWLLCFLLLTASYTICLLTWFPGVGMNDGLNILQTGMVISCQFPVFYVAFISVLKLIGYHFGSLQVTVALYSVFQVLLVSALSSSLLLWLSRKKIPAAAFRLVFFFYLCSPLLAMYAVSMLKDTVFSLLLAVLSAFLYEVDRSDGRFFQRRRSCILFFLACIGVLFSRNNGAFIVVLLLLVLLPVYRAYKKQIVTLLAGVILGAALSSFATHFYSDGQLFQEAAAVPIQQLAACVKEDGNLTDDEKVFLNRIMPLEAVKQRYNPYAVDSIKWADEAGFDRVFFEANKKQFMKIWAQALPRNFKIYLMAWLRETYWFWAPRQVGSVECYFSIETVADNEWLAGFMQEWGIHDAPVLPQPLNSYLREYYGHAKAFLREGVCFWLMLAAAVLSRNRCPVGRRCLGIYLPTLLLWLSLMISTPVAASFRYVLVYAYLLPLIFALLFEKTGSKPQ